MSSTAPPPLMEAANEPCAEITRTELKILVSALAFATGKGIWMVDDLELMGRIQMRLRHLQKTLESADDDDDDDDDEEEEEEKATAKPTTSESVAVAGAPSAQQQQQRRKKKKKKAAGRR
jgi:hypothetical protein